MDIVMLNESPSFSKYINSTLMTLVNFISSDGWVAVACDPNGGEVIGVNFVLNELTLAVLMDVNPTRLPVMDFTLHHHWVRSSFHFKTCYPVVMNVIGFKITLYLKKESNNGFNSELISFMLVVCLRAHCQT